MCPLHRFFTHWASGPTHPSAIDGKGPDGLGGPCTSQVVFLPLTCHREKCQVDSAGDDTVAETHVSPETRYLLARGPALHSGKDIMPKRSRGPCRNTGWASREPKTLNLMCQHPALSLVILERITDDRLEAALSVLCSGLSRWFRGHGTPSVSQGLAPVPTPVAASPPQRPPAPSQSISAFRCSMARKAPMARTLPSPLFLPSQHPRTVPHPSYSRTPSFPQSTNT